MKTVLVFATLLGVTLGNNLLVKGLEISEGIHLHKQLARDILKKIHLLEKVDSGLISAIVDEYADKLFANIKVWAVDNGLDPILLPNVSQSFLTAYIDLWDGELGGISTINRSDDVVVEYSHSDKKITMTFPIVFEDLEFSYWYHVVLLLIGPEGKMIGTIDSFKAYIQISFDFNEYHAKIEKLSTWGMGQIHIRFEDGGILDIVADILSQLVVDVLHPLIEGIINGVINNVAETVVEEINNAIDNILHHNTTSAMDSEYLFKRLEVKHY